MKESEPIVVSELPVALNICDQTLREVWADSEKRSSLAHVEMQPGAESLLHKHQRMTEVYYILDGVGELIVGQQKFRVEKDTVKEIIPGTPHKLKNIGEDILSHQVLAIPAFDPDDVILLEEVI